MIVYALSIFKECLKAIHDLNPRLKLTMVGTNSTDLPSGCSYSQINDNGTVYYNENKNGKSCDSRSNQTWSGAYVDQSSSVEVRIKLDASEEVANITISGRGTCMVRGPITKLLMLKFGFLCTKLAGGCPSGDKTMDFRFPDFPDQESGKLDFQHVHDNQLSKSFKMRGHMIFFRFSGFSGSGIRKSEFSTCPH